MEKVELQARWKSPVFWLGMAGVAAQAVVGVLLACGAIQDTVAGAVVAGIAALEAYAVGNNPRMKGEF